MIDRLIQLHALRARIDDEIRAEQKRQRRIAELRAQLNPVDPFAGSTESIREWAQAEGYDVADEGGIRRSIREAYFEAHPEVQRPLTPAEERAAIREWAALQGIRVGVSGPISRRVREAWTAARNGSAA